MIRPYIWNCYEFMLFTIYKCYEFTNSKHQHLAVSQASIPTMWTIAFPVEHSRR